MTILKSFEKPLTPEEELKYLTKFKEEQDEHSKEVLIERNMRLVAHIAKKYNNSSEDQDDLISIGTIGLIKAIETYNIEKLRSVVCESVKLNKLNISFKFGSSAEFKVAKKQLVDNGKFRELIQFASLKGGVKLSPSYSYSLREEKSIIAFFISKI